MVTVTVGMPVFSGDPEEDVEQFIDLFAGYLAGLGIDPADMAGGPPSGSRRAMGLFRACMKGPAAVWFDEQLTGKRWRLNNLFNNHGRADWAGVVGRNMQQLIISNSFRILTGAHTYATAPANNAVTLTNSGLLPAYGLIQNWRDIGGQPTDNLTTIINAGNNDPIVLAEIRIGNAVWWFRNNYPTVLQEQREVRFGNLAQENDPVDIYYKKVQKFGRLLNFGASVIENQFFRGLSPENMLEADRIGSNKPLNEIVDSLKRVEKRKAEMRLGLSNRDIKKAIIQNSVTPIQMPSISHQEPMIMKQEPTIMKPTSLGITQEQLDQLLKTHTERIMQNFQNQLQVFQKEIIPQPMPIENKEPSSIFEFLKNTHRGGRGRIVDILQQMREDHKKNDSIAQEVGRELRQEDLKPIDLAVAQRFAERREQTKNKQIDNYIDNVLSGDLGKLNINGEDTDTSNLLYSDDICVRDSKLGFLDSDDEYTICAVRKKK